MEQSDFILGKGYVVPKNENPEEGFALTVYYL
jgi:hypothetical protein